MVYYIDNAAAAILAQKRVNVDFVVGSKMKRRLYVITKRLVDIFAGLIGAIILVPVAIVIKIVTVMSGDMNSIFFVQERIGQGGKVFSLYKFRSMVPDADKELERLLKTDRKLAAEYKRMRKLEKDPRVTKIGRILRKSSLDELPQLLNVLKGEMSLVGNRPYLPREQKDMGRYFREIVKVKPGLTGFWQVSLRSRGTFQERLKMEAYYAKYAGFRFDFEVLLKTFGTIVKGDGAK